MQARQITQMEVAVGFEHRYGYYSAEGDEHKSTFHRNAKSLLKGLAEKDLNLTKEQYDLRTNRAGPAVIGETTLHTDTVYVQFGCLGGGEILVRSCKGRKDYTGGSNNFFSVKDLKDNYGSFVELVKRCSNAGGIK